MKSNTYVKLTEHGPALAVKDEARLRERVAIDKVRSHRKDPGFEDYRIVEIKAFVSRSKD